MKLIIDTDPGIDDALAIALATALPEVELLGLTAVFGNTFVQQSSRNARFLLNFLGHPCPVSEGAEMPYGAQTYVPSANVHGPEGFGAMAVVQDIGANVEESAAAFLVRNARENPGELVVCAIGPLTNIADALKLDPLFARNIKSLVLMGGALDCPGNITPHAEANIFHDPAAADVVFSTDMPMVMIGLNATMKTLLTPDDFEKMGKNSPQIGGFIRDISDFYLGFYRSVGIFDGCPMHDSTAILACVAPDRFEMKQTGLRVILDGEDIGKTVADNARPPVDVAMDVEAKWAVDYVMARIATLN
ncbi:nucleoside hydrolase [Yoonia sp.]|uniref:nucleoside hydrolase n=1 Tax=Yoonia sp. TaxID=2212373 RepID=UPI0023A40EBE|nr:nucleoside hydrolase [Yoonia sp.]MDE0850508.1 nucleoside hydrolase [Yoonia sp.]